VAKYTSVPAEQTQLDETFLTVNGVARLLQINPQTLRNMIDRAEMPAVRIGQRRVRIKQSDLDSYIAA
jgi:excisionase family DNA binding protein